MNPSITRGWLGWLGAAVAALALAACGGGGGSAGQPAFGTGAGGGGGAAAPAVAELVVELSATTVANTGRDTVEVTVTAVDGARNVVSGAPVTVRADAGAIVTPAARVTDDTGRLRATLDIGADRSNRVITVTVSSGTRQAEVAEVLVVGARLSGTLLPAAIAPGQTGRVLYRLEDQAGRPMANTAIQVNAVGLTPASASGRTNFLGEFSFNYTAGAAGLVHITTQAGGAADTQVLRVQAAGSVPPVTVPITSATVQAEPIVVAANQPDSTSNRSTIRARFLGAGNAPIPNVRVRFDLAGDVNSIGGSFSTGNAVLLSDATGEVTSAYIPGTRSSPTNGVTVRACFALDDLGLGTAASPQCPNWVLATLTVGGKPLSVSIGTNERIIVNELTYVKRMIVAVVDSAGVGQADVDITASVDLPIFRKGLYEWSVADRQWNQVLRDICPNEDVNRNGVLEAGEDVNGNWQLDPRKADVSIRVVHPRTRDDGTAEIEIQYLRGVATWVDAVVTVAARVEGTEGRASLAFLPVPADAPAFRNQEVAPAFVTSPYGTQPGCNNPL